MATDHIQKLFAQYDQLKQSEKTRNPANDIDYSGLTIIHGSGHENLLTARNILAGYYKKLESFKAIIVVIRNPYDLMVSNYFFMRDSYLTNQEKKNFQIANENNFEDFAVKVNFAPIETWMTINGRQPENLRIFRFESLQDDFDAFASEFQLKSIPLPHINQSAHGHYSTYLTEKSEAAIYNKFKYLFDNGFYSRHLFGPEGQ